MAGLLRRPRATCLRRMPGMPISGLTWIVERTRKVLNDTRKNTTPRSLEKKMSTSNTIVVASAARTPVGSFNGAFANTPAHELGAVAIKEALGRAGVDAKEVDEVILGQVLTAAQGQNPARQAAMAAGVPAGGHRLGSQPALRLGPARHRARHAADRPGRCRDHRRRRPGIDVDGAARPAPAQSASRWATSS